MAWERKGNFPSSSRIDTAAVPNGGRSIHIEHGDGEENYIDIDIISSYAPQWEVIYDGNSFTSWDGREIKFPIGRRFSLSFSMYGLSKDDIHKLKELVTNGDFLMSCEDYSGMCRCDRLSAPVRSSNHLGTYYSCSMDISAVDTEAVDGGL